MVVENRNVNKRDKAKMNTEQSDAQAPGPDPDVLPIDGASESSPEAVPEAVPTRPAAMPEPTRNGARSKSTSYQRTSANAEHITPVTRWSFVLSNLPNSSSVTRWILCACSR